MNILEITLWVSILTVNIKDAGKGIWTPVDLCQWILSVAQEHIMCSRLCPPPLTAWLSLQSYGAIYRITSKFISNRKGIHNFAWFLPCEKKHEYENNRHHTKHEYHLNSAFFFLLFLGAVVIISTALATKLLICWHCFSANRTMAMRSPFFFNLVFPSRLRHSLFTHVLSF